MTHRMLLFSALLLASSWGIAHAQTFDVPAPGPVAHDADLVGAFLTVGSPEASLVIQISDATWQRDPDGGYTFATLDGVDFKGSRMVFTREVCGGVPVSVAEAGLLVNDSGFVVSRPGQNPVTFDWSHSCALTVAEWCENNGCTGTCGLPNCNCVPSGSGGCQKITRETCNGACPSNWRCNTSVNDCKCVELSPSPGVPGSPDRTELGDPPDHLEELRQTDGDDD